MANYAYDRMPAFDASFLIFESPNTHMHIAWTWVFEGGSLVGADGGVDIERVRRHVAARLYRFPRFRQRIRFTPLEGHPVWVDDEGFKLHYHVRHTSLTEPGDERRLKTTTSSILSQPLDRSKPLWELWVIEGLQDGGFAIVTKTHHCMVDGVSTVDLMTGLLDREPQEGAAEPVDWIPRPAPTTFELARDALLDRAGGAMALTRRLGASWQDNARLSEIRDGVDKLRQMIGAGMTGAVETPINRPVGPHRMVNWVRLPRPEVEALATALEATPTDIVLASIAGAVQRFFARSGFQLGARPFRVVLPESQRDESEPGTLGNRASGWILPLPVAEADPIRRFRGVVSETRRLHSGNRQLGLEWLLDVSALLGGRALELGIDVSRRLHPYNLIVTQIPGPQEPRYLLDAALVDAYPQLPLFQNQGLGIGVATYRDRLDIGLTADWEILPNLHDFAKDLRLAYDELRTLKAPKRRRPRAAATA